jgi:hypothetical protein
LQQEKPTTLKELQEHIGTGGLVQSTQPIVRGLSAITLYDWKWRVGDQVKKKSGSMFEGKIVGYYSTEQTPRGYAIESGAYKNTVQIFPEQALEDGTY